MEAFIKRDQLAFRPRPEALVTVRMLGPHGDGASVCKGLLLLLLVVCWRSRSTTTELLQHVPHGHAAEQQMVGRRSFSRVHGHPGLLPPQNNLIQQIACSGVIFRNARHGLLPFRKTREQANEHFEPKPVQRLRCILPDPIAIRNARNSQKLISHSDHAYSFGTRVVQCSRVRGHGRQDSPRNDEQLLQK